MNKKLQEIETTSSLKLPQVLKNNQELVEARIFCCLLNVAPLKIKTIYLLTSSFL